jgi:AraC family transcriptional regulator
MSHVASVFASPLISVRNAMCTSDKSGLGPTKGGMGTHLALIRRGCFHYQMGSRSLLADSSLAYIYDEGDEYRCSHPCDGGDDCSLFELEPELLVEVFGRRDRHEAPEFHITPSTQVAHLATLAVLRHDDSDRLSSTETTLGLMQAIARRPLVDNGLGRAAARQRRSVDKARAVLTVHLDRNLELSAVAQEAGCSPFHLMRIFRAETGQSLRAYRSRLRVAAALEQLADGAEDLTQLALAAGFASHSHLTNTFRSVLGASPSELREQLANGGIGEKRRFLQAALAAAA